MKRVKLSIDDLIEVLETLKEAEMESIYIIEHDGFPALCDADEPDNIIIFKELEDLDDSDRIH